MDELGFIDLFCGAGGAGLGLKLSGIRPLLGVDTDPFAVEIYRMEVGPAIKADVRELDPGKAVSGRPFLIWASPPCPPWSIGRKWRRKPTGFQTEEGWLLLEPLRWAAALRPEWVIIENVGTLPREVEEDLVSRLQEMGYVTRVLRLDACLWVAQKRDHKFVVGGPFPIPDPTAPSVSPRFSDIADGEGARPVEPHILRRWMKGKFAIPIVEADGKLPTVTTRSFHRRWTCAVYDGEGRYRFPTFREAARAQGFPDDHMLHRLVSKSSGVAWRLLGNAVPVPMAEALGRAILSVKREVSDAGRGPQLGN
jgi:site-specific DNA-cytosine methylase